MFWIGMALILLTVATAIWAVLNVRRYPGVSFLTVMTVPAVCFYFIGVWGLDKLFIASAVGYAVLGFGFFMRKYILVN